MMEWAFAALAPIGGWVFSVERRLAKLEAIKEKVDSTDEKVERLVLHLLGDPEDEFKFKGRR